jgi:hypothetical protein
MSTSETSRYVRVRVELVLEVDAPERLRAAALALIDADESMPRAERARAGAAVREDEAEALAYLVEPADLVEGIPGAELAQASWTSEQIDYDPDAVEWDLDEVEDEGGCEGDGGDEAGGLYDGLYERGVEVEPVSESEGERESEGGGGDQGGGRGAQAGEPAFGQVGGIAARVGGGCGGGR